MKFAQAQHAYIEQNFYTPTANAFKKVTGIDASKMPLGIQNALWSIGVQHGSGGARTIFKNAGVKQNDKPETILKKLYAERSKVDKYFKSSSASIKKGVYNRFQKELQDALKQV